MSRVCTVCAHDQRPAIDEALVAGDANRRIASHYDLSEIAVRRHKGGHLPAQMVKAQAAEDVAVADGLLEQLAACRASAKRIGEKAEAANDYRAALAGVRELVRIVEITAKLVGEIDERPQINLVTAPEWLLVRSTLLEALAPYPEARMAVAARLVRLEASA